MLLNGLLLAVSLLILLFSVPRAREHGEATPMDPSMSGPALKIPRVIHQTARHATTASRSSWDRVNPRWRRIVWSDNDSRSLVLEDFPGWIEAYDALSTPAERADFFRYVVLLSRGGVYADMDVECARPFDEVLLPSDQLVVGWENHFETLDEASRRTYGRRVQLLQWTIAAAPNHPALRTLCERVAQNALRDASVLTLEKTGPAVFTDELLRATLSASFFPYPHAMESGNDIEEDEMKVTALGFRALPRVVWGSNKSARAERRGDPWHGSPGVAARHFYSGTWKEVYRPFGKLGVTVGKERKIPPGSQTGEAPPHDSKLTWDSLSPIAWPVAILGHGSAQAFACSPWHTNATALERHASWSITAWGIYAAGLSATKAAADPSRSPIPTLLQVTPTSCSLVDFNGQDSGFLAALAFASGRSYEHVGNCWPCTSLGLRLARAVNAKEGHSSNGMVEVTASRCASARVVIDDEKMAQRALAELRAKSKGIGPVLLEVEPGLGSVAAELIKAILAWRGQTVSAWAWQPLCRSWPFCRSDPSALVADLEGLAGSTPRSSIMLL